MPEYLLRLDGSTNDDIVAALEDLAESASGMDRDRYRRLARLVGDAPAVPTDLGAMDRLDGAIANLLAVAEGRHLRVDHLDALDELNAAHQDAIRVWLVARCWPDPAAVPAVVAISRQAVYNAVVSAIAIPAALPIAPASHITDAVMAVITHLNAMRTRTPRPAEMLDAVALAALNSIRSTRGKHPGTVHTTIDTDTLLEHLAAAGYTITESRRTEEPDADEADLPDSIRVSATRHWTWECERCGETADTHGWLNRGDAVHNAIGHECPESPE